MAGGAVARQASRPSRSGHRHRHEYQYSHGPRRQLVRQEPGNRAGRVHREQHRRLSGQRQSSRVDQHSDERAHRHRRLLGRFVQQLRRRHQRADEHGSDRRRSPGLARWGSGVQILKLNIPPTPPAFQTPFKMTQAVSEDISIDPGRNLLLSPNEGNNYPLLSLNSSSGAVTGEFDRPISTPGDPDSAAEDCSTGIALSSDEFESDVYAADLMQATLTPGTPGSWTSPSTLFTLTGTSGFSARIRDIGRSGIVASGDCRWRVRRQHLWRATVAIGVGHRRQQPYPAGLRQRANAEHSGRYLFLGGMRSAYDHLVYQPQHRSGYWPIRQLDQRLRNPEVDRGDQSHERD